MTTDGCILIRTALRWRISQVGRPEWHDLDVADADDASQVAEAVEAAFEQFGLGERQVVLAVPNRAALSATFDISAADARYRTTLCYELEDLLPWSAEATIADFMVQDGRALGVGIQRDAWLPIVSELESRGIRVQSIEAVALAGLQHCANESWWRSASGVVWIDGLATHVVHLLDGRPIRWSLVGHDPAAAYREMDVHTFDSTESPQWVIVNADEDWGSDRALPDKAHLLRVASDALEDHASELATDVLSGKTTPWLEFRRDTLAIGSRYRSVQRALATLAVSVVALVVAWLAVFGYGSIRHYRLADELYHQQEDVFREAFPNSAVPAAVLSRLRSEHTRRAAARHAPRNLQLPTPALNIVRDFLKGLPASQRIYVREVRVEDGHLDLVADVPHLADANTLADALRQQGFEVPPPSTEQNMDRTVSVRLFANWQSQPPATSSKEEAP